MPPSPGSFSLKPTDIINQTTGQTAGSLGSSLNANISTPPPTPPKAVAVVTSGTAKADSQNKQTQFNQLQQDVQNQKTATSQSTTSPFGTTQADVNSIQSNLDKLHSELLTPTPTETPVDSEQARINKLKAEKEAQDAQLQQDHETKLTQILNGTIPLNPSQQAMIDSMRQQFQAVIDAQKIANQAYTGGLTQSYASLGIEQSAPTQALGSLMNSVSIGNAKIADINSKMTSALAEMSQGFMTDNYKMVNDAWKNTADYMKQKQDTIDTMQKKHDEAIAQVNAAKEKAQKTYFDQVTKPLQDIQTVLSQNGAPQELIAAVGNSEDVSQALQMSSGYMTPQAKATLPSSVQEYQFYADQTKNGGGVPVAYDDWLTRDANRKAKAITAASATGLPAATLTKVQTVANHFDTLPQVKDYNTIATNVAYMKSLGVSPTDDIARIYIFARVQDPTSSVKEGEYKTVQDYAQALLQKYGLTAKRVFDNVGFLTPEARGFLETTLDKRLSTQEKTYKNVYDETTRKINHLTGAKDGSDYLTDYTLGFTSTGSEVAQSEAEAETSLQSYRASHPEKEFEMKQASDSLEATLGHPITAQEFLQSFPEYK